MIFEACLAMNVVSASILILSDITPPCVVRPDGESPRGVADEVGMIVVDLDVVNRRRGLLAVNGFEDDPPSVGGEELVAGSQLMSVDPALFAHPEGVHGGGADDASGDLEVQERGEVDEEVHDAPGDGDRRRVVLGKGEDPIPLLQFLEMSYLSKFGCFPLFFRDSSHSPAGNTVRAR